MVLNLIKNVVFSALLIAGMTVASVTIAFVGALLLTSQAPMPEPALVTFGIFVVTGLAMLAGVWFSVGTLFAALLTMPPTIWIARVLKLPRPLVDMAGGAAVAALCVSLALAELNGGMLAELATPEAAIIFKIVGVLAGALIGYVRYAWLVRPRQARAAAPSPEIGGLARG